MKLYLLKNLETAGNVFTWVIKKKKKNTLQKEIFAPAKALFRKLQILK